MPPHMLWGISRLNLKGFISNNFTNARTGFVETKDYEIICRNDYPSDVSSSIVLNFVQTDDVYKTIVEALKKGKNVDRIFVLRDENTFHIWTSLSQYDKKTRYALYGAELELIRLFSAVEYHFDFHIAESEDIKGLLSSGAKLIFSRQRGYHAG